MKSFAAFLILLLIVFTQSCKEQTCQPLNEELYYPSQELGELFHDVQMSNIFVDGKTFVDYIPKCSPESIRKIYNQQKNQSDFNLEEFIAEYFNTYPKPDEKIIDHKNISMEDYLNLQWDNLTRYPDTTYLGSFLPIPNPYVVPGGRFREVYYWDSYFTMLGLAQSGKIELVKNMVDNFAYLIDTYGHIPNGNRTYYLSRSQPPYFSLMVGLLSEYLTEDEALKYLSVLEKEYEFWMDGVDKLNNETLAYRRVVKVDSLVLNRYWDDLPEPRPEAYKPDYELAMDLPSKDKEVMYTNLKATAESGWDFSSRWFEDKKELKTIRTTELIPVDLNCLLYNLEQTIADLCELEGDMQKWTHYTSRAQSRKKSINQYFWNAETGYYADYDIVNQKVMDMLTAASATPLFVGIADSKKATQTMNSIFDNLVFDGGLVTTLNDTGQQWDYPNGWAPLQWIAIKGFLNYGERDMALKIARNWLELNRKVYRNTGKMMEKYNVVDTTLFAGGGEYALQDGFGWTNGVDLQLLDEFPELVKSKEMEEINP